MNEYTPNPKPRPWKAKHFSGDGSYYLSDAWGVTYPYDYGDRNPVSVWLVNPQFCEADAHLIAAAPDLLAVCEALLLYYENSIGQSYSEGFLDDTDYAEAVRILGVAKATIAKAKGESIDE